MMRTFKITLPADTAVHNLFSLIVGTAVYGLVNGGTNETGITGVIPSGGIMPDLVSLLIIIGDSGNTGTVSINDRNNANTTGPVPAKSTIFNIGPSMKNSINLKDYFLQGSAASQVVEVLIESY
jgi:hypothetical protein